MSRGFTRALSLSGCRNRSGRSFRGHRTPAVAPPNVAYVSVNIVELRTLGSNSKEGFGNRLPIFRFIDVCGAGGCADEFGGGGAILPGAGLEDGPEIVVDGDGGRAGEVGRGEDGVVGAEVDVSGLLAVSIDRSKIPRSRTK